MLVEDTIVQGLSKYSGNGLAVYGMVQVKLFENYEQAFELGQLSLSISQELQVADSVVGTAILSVGVLHIKQPIRDLVDPLSRAFDRCFSDGHLFFGTVAATYSLIGSLASGFHLADVLENARSFIELFRAL
jgi:hypothetical protein